METEEDYFAAAYEEELAMEEEARQAEAPAPHMDAAGRRPTAQGRLRLARPRRLRQAPVPEESRADGSRRRGNKLQAPGAAVLEGWGCCDCRHMTYRPSR